MNIAVRQPGMTREGFLDWAAAQDGRHEFDGYQPVAMVGNSLSHGFIVQNLFAALRAGLRGSGYRPVGPDVGLAILDNAVRFPDAMVACTEAPGTDRLAQGVVVVFEVLSPSSGRIDRVTKLAEYRSVPSIRRYVILEHTAPILTVLARPDGTAGWTATALALGDTLQLPEIGMQIPVADLYESTDLHPPLPPGEGRGEGA